MQKTILITGATDGIGLETAKMLVSKGLKVLLHGRSSAKMQNSIKILKEIAPDAELDSFLADLSSMTDVTTLAESILQNYPKLDVIINNAGVLKAPHTITSENLDIRFAVNTIAPYLLTTKLLPTLNSEGRIINLSSAAQAPVDISALKGGRSLSDMDAYSQSKLAITMWSRQMAQEQGKDGPIIISVNPGSLLASKMVKEGFGVAGNDLKIGADILTRLSLDAEFASQSGNYFDNDAGRFSNPHPDALDDRKCALVTTAIQDLL